MSEKVTGAHGTRPPLQLGRKEHSQWGIATFTFILSNVRMGAVRGTGPQHGMVSKHVVQSSLRFTEQAFRIDNHSLVLLHVASATRQPP